MSFAKAKIRRFHEINDENQLPGPGHYDPYKKSDHRTKVSLKTINSHAKKDAKKTRAKLSSVLRERINKSEIKQELLHFADEGSQKVKEVEVDIINEKLAQITIQMENKIDQIVQKAAAMELYYIEKLRLKNFEIQDLKEKLSSLSVFIMKGAEENVPSCASKERGKTT